MEVQQITEWKTTFFKNVTKEGGAMNYAIKQAPKDNIIIHSQTVKSGRMWGFTTPLKFLKLIEKNKGLYEVITQFPHKLYFDIDGDDKCPDLETIKNIITRFFPDAKMAVSGSKTETKISYHIIVSNYHIHNEEERTYIKTIVKHINTTVNDAFDWKVYTKNRNMKCINQSKDDKRVQSIIEGEDYKNHLITCFLDNYSLPFQKLNEEIEEVIMIEKSKATVDLALLPKLKLIEPKDIDIINITPLEILQLLPISKSFNHAYTHRVARFCYYNNIDFKVFLSWINHKHTDLFTTGKDKIIKWEKHFKNLHKFPEVPRKQIESILSYYYPNILKDKSYKSFLNTFSLPHESSKIETITPKDFEASNKYLLFNIGMGGGKTTQTINYLKNNNNFIWFCPNKALANNTLYRLEQEKVETEYYLNFNATQKKNGALNELNNLIIVLNSVHYLSNKSFDVVVIDEIETLLDKFLGDFMKNKKEIWNSFLYILRNAKKIILLDAFITTKTLNFIKSLENDSCIPLIYERINEPITRTINYIKNEEIMIEDIINKLKNNKKCFIYYPYKYGGSNWVGMEQLANMIKLASGKEGVFYNADVDDTVKGTLKNVNKAWKKFDFVITNNIITCGVNYDITNDFDESYLFVASFSCPRDIIQVSYRVRDLINKKINVCYMGRMNQPNTFKADNFLINCPLYDSLINNILIEKFSPLKKTFQLFCNKAHYNQVVDKKVINDELRKYITDLKETADCGFSYANIPDIDWRFAELIEQKMFSQDANMIEKIMLKKYYFIMEWKVEGCELKNEEGENCIESYWNDNLCFFFQQLKKPINDENNLFNKIKKFNNLKGFFPTNEEIKHLKLNDDLLTEIFNEFKFKFISKTSNAKKIIQEIFNVYFKKCIIKSTCLNKNTTYTLNIEECNEYYNFADLYIKKPTVKEVVEKLLPEEEDNVCEF